jgi:hypothetical protein
MDFLDFVNFHNDFEWEFLYGPSEVRLRDIFNLSTVPEYALIDPEGKLVWDYTPAPSEGAALKLEQIAKKQRQTSGGSK